MYFLIVSAVLNTVLDLWFVISFGWGVVGVAVATVIAQAVCAAFSIFYMFRRYPIFRFRRSEFVFDTDKFRLCLKLGHSGHHTAGRGLAGQRVHTAPGQQLRPGDDERLQRRQPHGELCADTHFRHEQRRGQLYRPECRSHEVRPRKARLALRHADELRHEPGHSRGALFPGAGLRPAVQPERRGARPGGRVPALDELLHHTLCHVHAHDRTAPGRGRRHLDFA